MLDLTSYEAGSRDHVKNWVRASLSSPHVSRVEVLKRKATRNGTVLQATSGRAGSRKAYPGV